MRESLTMISCRCLSSCGSLLSASFSDRMNVPRAFMWATTTRSVCENNHTRTMAARTDCT